MIVLDPEGSVDTDNLAVPFTSEAEPRAVEPELNDTVPVGNAVLDLTIAVKEILLPSAAGLIDEISCSVVAA